MIQSVQCIQNIIYIFLYNVHLMCTQYNLYDTICTKYIQYNLYDTICTMHTQYNFDTMYTQYNLCDIICTTVYSMCTQFNLYDIICTMYIQYLQNIICTTQPI